MCAEDTDDLLHIFADPAVMASFGVPPFQREQMDGWVQRNLRHQAQYGYGLFAVILLANGLLIGDCGLEHLEIAGSDETELGYDLRSAFWNQGLATEAACAVRDFAFVELKLPRLISLIRPGNGASQRVAEKIGMCLEATITREQQEYRLYALTYVESIQHRPH
jgi:ribosomal-protein-alanine N-acetyltransferase